MGLISCRLTGRAKLAPSWRSGGLPAKTSVYFDLGLGDENGADLIPFVEKLYPAARIIVVSGHIDDGFLDAKTALEVQRHGVILPKPVGPDELAAALRRRSPMARGVSVHEIAESLGFSRRQGLILDGLLQHKANKEIAAELDSSPSTIRVHITRMLEKAGCRSRRELIELCRSWAALGGHA